MSVFSYRQEIVHMFYAACTKPNISHWITLLSCGISQIELLIILCVHTVIIIIYKTIKIIYIFIYKWLALPCEVQPIHSFCRVYFIIISRQKL